MGLFTIFYWASDAALETDLLNLKYQPFDYFSQYRFKGGVLDGSLFFLNLQIRGSLTIKMYQS